ncbi:MAG: DUF2029 domain-containing protein [Actinobacteria bacterium]|nr:DUF2029 domain-containing protein [Actinomycetota bacterium]
MRTDSRREVPDFLLMVTGGTGVTEDGAKRHWLDADRLRVYPRIFLAIYALAIVGYALSLHDGLDFRGQIVGADFVTFYAAAKLALTGHAAAAWDFGSLVAMQRQVFPAYTGEGFAWFYPPPFLLLVTPLALLPHLAALGVFLGSTATAWVLVLRRAIGRPGAGWLIAAFPGLWICALQGQNGMLTAALAGGSILLHRRRPVLSGVVLGLLVIKPHLAMLFAVALLASRAWRTIASAAVTAAALLGISVAVFGAGVLPAWLDSLQLARVATEDGLLPWSKMPSMFAALRLVGTPVAWAYAGHAVVAVAAGIAVWLVWRRSSSLALRGAVLMAGTFVANPYAFDYDLVWLSFPIAWLALVGLRDGWRRGDRTVLVAAWLIPAVGTALAAATHVLVTPFGIMALTWIALRRAIDTRTLPAWLSGAPRPPAATRRRWSRPA